MRPSGGGKSTLTPFMAKTAGLNREGLYKALGEAGNPEFGTVMRIVRALGLTLSAHPAASGQTSKRRRMA
jgi:DNA-binding phage protein